MTRAADWEKIVINGVNDEDSLYSPTSLQFLLSFQSSTRYAIEVEIFREWEFVERESEQVK